MLNRLKRLKVKHQLALAGGLVAIPMIILVGRDIASHAERIDAAQSEVSGLRDLAPYSALLQAVPGHRALVQMRIGGGDVEAQRASVALRIDTLVAQAHGGNATAPDAQPPMDLRDQWQALRRGWQGQPAIQTAGAHAQMLDTVVAAMDAIAHRSGLLPSRSPETYRIAHVVVRTVPGIIASLDEALALEQARRGGGGPADDDIAQDRRFFALDLAGAKVAEVLSSMEPGAARESLDVDLTRLSAIETALTEGRGGGLTDQRLAALGEDAVKTAYAIHETVSQALENQLTDRIAALETTRNIEVAGLIVALGLVGLLLAIIGRTITQPIGRLVGICRELGAGRYDQPLNRNVGGDMDVVIGALADLQDELARERQTRQQAERERERLRDQFVQAQKMEALGTLAGGIAHDFNNVIAAIIGQAELAMFASQSGKPVEDRLERVVKAGLRAKAVVQQILSFARQESTVETEPVSPSQMLRETVELVETGLQDPVSISVDTDGEIGLIRINPSQCHQLLLNVLVNAGHATGDTGAPIACGVRAVDGATAAGSTFTTAPGDGSPPRHELWSGELGDGAYANLWVADRGGGMERETLVRIYDPFFTTRTDGKGSGLGLSAAQGIVLNAGGAIHVGTTPGLGTRFDIFLPLLAEAEAAQPATEASAAPQPGTARILLVDDNDDALEAAAAVLQAHEHTVSAYSDGREALTAFDAADAAYDLVVTDHNMPGLTGLDLAAELHARKPDLRIILITGRIDKALRSRASAAGISAFVEKPFQADELAAAVRRTLAGSGGDAGDAT